MSMVSSRTVSIPGQPVPTASGDPATDEAVLLAPFHAGTPSEENPVADPNGTVDAMRLRAQYGPWFLRRNGRWILNDGFWGAWLCARLGVFFDPGSDVFRTTLVPITQANRLSAGALAEPVHVLLVEAAKALAPAFPANELRDARIRQLIKIMKVVPRSEAFSREEPPAESKPRH